MAKTKTKLEKRKSGRYRLENLKNAFVVFPKFLKGKDLKRPLFNLSYKGLGFRPYDKDPKLIPILQEIPALLFLGKEKISVRLEVIYQTADLSGARLHMQNKEDIRKIIRFIPLMVLGKSLEKVDSKLTPQNQSRKKLCWYAGYNNTELALWRTLKGELLEFSLTFYLYAIKGNIKEETLITADLNPMELGYIPIYEDWPKEVAKWNKKTNRETLQLALELLDYADHVPANDLEEVSSWILSGYGLKR